MCQMNRDELKNIPAVSSDSNPEGLDAISELVFSMIDGISTIEDLADCCGLDPELAARIVGDLASQGLVSLPSGDPDVGSSVETREEPDEDDDEEAEEIDESEFASAVREAFEELGSRNYYELIGAEPDADRKALRSAYFSHSKKFHPDRAYGKSRAELREKMELIFRQMTIAYDVLSSTSSRKEYDARIADQLDLWRIGKELERAMNKSGGEEVAGGKPNRDSERPSVEVTQSSRPRNGPVVRTTVHPRQTRVKATISKPGRKRPAQVERRGTAGSSAPPEDREARRERWRRERMGKALGMAINTNSIAPAAKKDQRFDDRIGHARIAMERAEYDDAARLLQSILEEDPDNKVATSLLELARKGAISSMARGSLSKGQIERRQGNTEKALELFEQALAAEPGNLEARHLLADALLEVKRDLSRALLLSKEVVALGGQRARYFATLGELFAMAKEYTRAREAFERAIALEPDNRELKKRLKACKA